MKKPLTDDQIEDLLRTIVRDASADNDTISAAANSPAIWWSVRRQIEDGNAAARSPWPPIHKFWKWALLGVPAATVLILSTFFYFARSDGAKNVASVSPGQAANPNVTDAGPIPAPKSYTSNSAAEPLARRKMFNVTKIKSAAAPHPKAIVATTAREKVTHRSEFIALSFDRTADSGQMLRVKVPSSMMVTLGLVSTVEKPTALVDADVIVGDDGLARAIRFIH